MRKAAFFHHLPSGGAVRDAGQQLFHLRSRFEWKIHLLEGSAPLLPDSGLPVRRYPFPEGRRLRGARRLLAPILLFRKAKAFIAACKRISESIDSEDTDAALVHKTDIISAPPILYQMDTPSVFFCQEYPRYIYEKGIYRTGSRLTEFLAAPVNRLERRLDLRAARSADIMVANSSFMAKRMRQVYQREMEIIHPGIDTRRYSPDRNIVREDFVLSVGALTGFKGHHLVLEALGMLEGGRSRRMLIVSDRGSRHYHRSLQHSAARRGVELTVSWRIPDSELIDLYRRAAVVVCAQKDEPYGLVPLEAMGCAAPVLAVSQGGFEENLEHQRTGLLAERTPQAIASGLSQILGNSELARTLGENGRRFVTSARDVRTEAESVAALMEEVAG